MKSRRQFIQHCSSALLSASVFPVMGASASAAAAPALTYSAFAPLTKSAFQLLSPTGAAIPILLDSADLHCANATHAMTDERNFTLRFTSQQTQVIGDGLYSFRHPALGTVEMFVIETTARDGDTKNYLATFQGVPVSSAKRLT
jgi:hypothetical protein